MKGRLTRWVGLGLMALAALTMVAGDVFAAPTRGPQTTFTLHFDLFSPAGISCTADAPGASVRSDRDLTGKPILHVTGDLTGASVTCTGPDGARFQAPLPPDSRERLAVAVEGLVLWRNGQTRVPLLVRADRWHYTAYERHSFTRLH